MTFESSAKAGMSAAAAPWGCGDRAAQTGARSFHGGGVQRRACLHRRRDEEASLSGQRHGLGLGFDLDDALVPAYAKRHAGFESGLAPHFARNDQSAGGVHGNCHGMKFAMPNSAESLRAPPYVRSTISASTSRNRATSSTVL